MQSLENEIHIYRLDLAEDSAAPDAAAWALLDAGERERALRFRHGPARRAFVRVRSALRVLLGRYLGRDPAAIAFDLGGKGKPRLAGAGPDRGLVFNVSHSGDCGLIALALDTALGVDVERMRAMAHMDGMAERCFAESELAAWRALPEDRRGPVFFALWSYKEAFLKATGEGIALGLQSCVVDLAGPGLSAVPPGFGPAEAWRLAAVEAGAGYGAAVCHLGAERRLRVARMDSLNPPAGPESR